MNIEDDEESLSASDDVPLNAGNNVLNASIDVMILRIRYIHDSFVISYEQ